MEIDIDIGELLSSDASTLSHNVMRLLDGNDRKSLKSTKLKTTSNQENCSGNIKDETPHICRVCTCKDTNLNSIYDLTEISLKICEMLTILVPQVPICSSDILPKSICSSCLDKLFTAYEFQEMYIASDEYLRTFLESQSVQHESVYIEEDSLQASKIINIIEIVKDETNYQVVASDSQEGEDEVITEGINNFQKTVKLDQIDCDETIDYNLVNLLDLKKTKRKKAHKKDNRTTDFDFAAPPIEKKSKSKTKILTSGGNQVNATATMSNTRPQLSCPHCDKSFESAINLKRHLQVFKCDLCEKEFLKTKLLALHLLTHPENQKFKCSLCAKTFPYQARLNEHMNKHNGIKPFECEICEKSFHQKKALSTHMRTHKDIRRFNCVHCGKAFKSSGNLSQHMMIHAKLKPYLCDMCGASFARVAALEQHKQTHSDERPYNCDECDKSFKLLCQIKRHMKIHAGQKPHKCQLCERSFTESIDLKKHLRKHIGGKVYKCEKCAEAFEFKKELLKHELDHYREDQQKQEQNSLKSELKIDVIY